MISSSQCLKNIGFWSITYTLIDAKCPGKFTGIGFSSIGPVMTELRTFIKVYTNLLHTLYVPPLSNPFYVYTLSSYTNVSCAVGLFSYCFCSENLNFPVMYVVSGLSEKAPTKSSWRGPDFWRPRGRRSRTRPRRSTCRERKWKQTTKKHESIFDWMKRVLIGVQLQNASTHF
jgi:hypothetical protein